MKTITGCLTVAAILLFVMNLNANGQDVNYSGTYETEWGRMVLQQNGSSVTGSYEHDNGRLEGTVSGNVITGNWYEEPTSQPPTDAGTYRFDFNSDGSEFQGSWKYGYADSEWSGQWIGKKIMPAAIMIGGVYETDWGTLVLTQDANTVTGNYTHDDGKIEGVLKGLTLTGKWSESPSYQPSDDAGLFEFIFTSDLKSFTGSWKYGLDEGPLTSGVWNGQKKE